MPKLSSKLVSQEFMESVRRGETYCPQAGSFQHTKAVVSKPSIDFLLDSIFRWTEKGLADKTIKGDLAKPWIGLMNRLIDGKLPDREWLITVVSIVIPDHEIFSKSYVFVKPDHA